MFEIADSMPDNNSAQSFSGHPAQSEFDVIIIGSGIGGLVTATQLAAKGAKVLILESYLIPGL